MILGYKNLFLYATFVAPFICNTKLILHGNKAWMEMLGFVIGKFGTSLEKDKPSFKATLHPEWCICDSDMKRYDIH